MVAAENNNEDMARLDDGHISAEQSRVLNSMFSKTFDTIRRTEEKSLDNRLTYGLSISEVHTIAAIGLRERVPMNVIAGRLNVTLATMTAAINKLYKKGCVERERNENDRRQVLVSLTSKGRKVRRTHDLFHQKMVARALETLDAQEVDVLSSALEKIKVFFDEENAKVKARNAEKAKKTRR